MINKYSTATTEDYTGRTTLEFITLINWQYHIEQILCTTVLTMVFKKIKNLESC
jgi:hypothetical protein